MRAPLLVIPILFLLLSAGIDSVSAEDKNNEKLRQYWTYLQEGADAFAAGELPKALARFRAAWKLKPERPEVHYWIGLVWSDKGDYKTASTHAQKAIAADEKYADAWLLWGQSLLYLHQWTDGHEKLRKALALDDTNPQIHFNIGRCYYHHFNDKTGALKWFNKALELDPGLTEALFYKGCCQLDLKNHRAAAATFIKVLKVNPRNVAAWYRLGFTLFEAGEPQEALKAYRWVIKIDPQHADAHLRIAEVYLKELPNKKMRLFHLRKFVQYADPNHAALPMVKEHLDNLTREEKDETTDGPASATRRDS